MTANQLTPGQLTPDVTTALLRHFSYGPVSKIPGRYEVWTAPGREDEILVPLNPSSGDFEALLMRAARTVFAEEGEAAQRAFELLTMKLNTMLDSTQWKKDTPVDAGLIPWAEGEALYQAAQSTLIASAKATRKKRMLHGSSSAYVAKRFLEKTLMGQTEIGSFVITAHVRSDERFFVSQRSENRAQEDYRHGERLSGRDVLRTLEQSLEAVRSGLDEYRQKPAIEAFLPLVEDGVSHELVKALATITHGSDAAVAVELNDGVTSVRRKEVAFDSIESSVLHEVAERFSEAEPPVAVTVTGEVAGLDNSTTSPIHLVKLDIVRGAEVKRARVRLTPEQYTLAVTAHAESLWLTLSGQLEKDGREYWLYGAKEVRLVTPPPGAVTQAIEISPL